ncbi:hypothetical protein M231_06245, partial [Tremella mesenterica]
KLLELLFAVTIPSINMSTTNQQEPETEVIKPSCDFCTKKGFECRRKVGTKKSCLQCREHHQSNCSINKKPNRQTPELRAKIAPKKRKVKTEIDEFLEELIEDFEEIIEELENRESLKVKRFRANLEKLKKL